MHCPFIMHFDVGHQYRRIPTPEEGRDIPVAVEMSY